MVTEKVIYCDYRSQENNPDIVPCRKKIDRKKDYLYLILKNNSSDRELKEFIDLCNDHTNAIELGGFIRRLFQTNSNKMYIEIHR